MLISGDGDDSIPGIQIETGANVIEKKLSNGKNKLVHWFATNWLKLFLFLYFYIFILF